MGAEPAAEEPSAVPPSPYFDDDEVPPASTVAAAAAPEPAEPAEPAEPPSPAAPSPVQEGDSEEVRHWAVGSGVNPVPPARGRSLRESIRKTSSIHNPSPPLSPLVWNFNPSQAGTDVSGVHEVALNRVDTVIGEGVVGPGGAAVACAAMVLYLISWVATLVSLFYLMASCEKYIGGLGLVMAIFADWATFFIGRCFNDHSIFFWPTTLKVCAACRSKCDVCVCTAPRTIPCPTQCIPLLPCYELVWCYRAVKEWRADHYTEHVPRFIHAFGAVLCTVRFVVFTAPQAAFLALVETEAKGDAIDKGVFYATVGLHGAFAFVLYIYCIQVRVCCRGFCRVFCLWPPRARHIAPLIHSPHTQVFSLAWHVPSLNLFGLPKLHVFSTTNLPHLLCASFIALAVYCIAILIPVLSVSTGDCTE